MSDSLIPLSIPNISGNEWKYVKDCLDTGWVSSAGKYVDKFENEIKQFIDVKHAVACVSGTAALQISLQVVGVLSGDEVIVPTLTFIASVNAIRYVGAEPVFMDCDEYYNINVEKTIEFLYNHTEFKNGFTINKLTGKKISAIIPVHVFGNPADIFELIEICKSRNIKVVEDAAESLGAYYNTSEKIKYKLITGSIGDIGCFSFNGNKIITTGGGGMIVTNKTDYAEKAKYLTTQAKDDELHYIHNEIGYNYRLTNVQAAIGVAQLESLSKYIEIKKKNYNILKNEINKIHGLQIADVPDYAESNYWYYCLQIDKDKYGLTKGELMMELQSSKIQTRPVWFLNHLQKPYKNCYHYKIEKAFQLLENTLNIPCSVDLTKSDLNRIVKVLRRGK